MQTSGVCGPSANLGAPTKIMKKVGFGNGSLWKVADKYSKSTIDIYRSCGNDVIEICINNLSEVSKLPRIVSYINDFAYKSIHLPNDIAYKNDERTKRLLDVVSDYYKEINANLILVHPDIVEDWEIFNPYKLNWAVENMDKEKQKYKTVSDLAEFFKTKPDWKLVLDLNHCYTNDKTMKLARDMIDQFKNKISEIHLSGYINLHDPLFQTKQNFILDYCKETDVPIVIESVLDSVNDAEKEYKYIKEYLK